MHVAYLHYLYGQDTALHHVRQFAAAARELGHRVDVHAMNLAPAGGGDGKTSLSGRLRRALKRRFSRYLHDPKELYWNLRYVRRELALLRPEPPDVLLVRNHHLGVSCVPVARRLGVPLVLEVNAPAAEARQYFGEYSHLGRLQEWTSRWKLRRADAVVVVSSALKSHLAARYRLDPERISVATNGADLERFRPETPPDPEFPRHEAEPRIGFVGSFQQFHGLDLLAGMTQRVAAARPAARFLFVGGGAGAERLRRRLDLGDRAAFTGRVPHQRVPGLMASLDVGVLAEAAPYQCPLKLIELMAAGKAIVAPRHGPIEELVADGAEALLFEPRDLDALVSRVLEFADNLRLRRDLGRAAARRAHASLSWRDNAWQVLAACDGARLDSPAPLRQDEPRGGGTK